MMKGALHETHLDDIMQCVEKPDKIVKNIKSSISHFEKQTRNDVYEGLLELGMAFADVSKDIISCDPRIT